MGTEDVEVVMPYRRRTLLLNMKRGLAAFVSLCAWLSLASPVLAQDKTRTDPSSDSKSAQQPTEGLSLNLPVPSNFASQLELPVEAVGSSVFKLDLTSSGCATGSEGCLSRDEGVKFGVSDTFRRHSEKGLDLSLIHI